MILNAVSFLISAAVFFIFTRLVAPVSNFDVIIGVIIAVAVFYPLRRLVARYM